MIFIDNLKCVTIIFSKIIPEQSLWIFMNVFTHMRQQFIRLSLIKLKDIFFILETIPKSQKPLNPLKVNHPVGIATTNYRNFSYTIFIQFGQKLALNQVYKQNL